MSLSVHEMRALFERLDRLVELQERQAKALEALAGVSQVRVQAGAVPGLAVDQDGLVRPVLRR